MFSKQKRGLRATAKSTILLTFVSLLVLVPARAALADPACQPGGVYVLFARGSKATLGSNEAYEFKNSMFVSLAAEGVGVKDWAELGNLDKSKGDGEFPDSPLYEYPASDFFGGHYNESVVIGTDELVNHLNDRYSGDGPDGHGPCTNEVVALGGYSQGADVVGWALERNGGGGFVSLTSEARRHVGFAALYGDPRYKAGCFEDAWWRRVLTNTCFDGMLLARNPYAREEFRGRVGSWCESGDPVCTWNPQTCNATNLTDGCVHGSVYQDYWIQRSATEVAHRTRVQLDLLRSASPNATVAYNNQLHAFYYDETNGNLRHAWTDANGWHAETLDGSATGVSGYSTHVGRYVSATVYGGIQVFYYDLANASLRHAWYDNTSWQFETLDAVGDVGQFVSIVNYGGLHAFYHDATNGDLKHKWYDGSWHTEVLDSAGYTGQYISISQYGGLHLFYYDAGQGDLRHAWYAGQGWQFETLDSSADVGKYTSVANNGTMHLFYYDATNGNLRHAWWAYWNSRWEFETLDSVGDVGRYTSAVVYGDLHVFYYDATNGDLKHAFYQGGWQFERLDTASLSVGMYVSSTVFGTPHLFYHDPLFGTLRHGFWASWNNRWEYEVLDGTSSSPGGVQSIML